MDYRIDTEKITSSNLDILKKSLEIIDEHLEKEKQRGASVEVRANILIPFITIGATVILRFSTSIGTVSNSITAFICFMYLMTIIFFIKSVYYLLASFQVIQHHRLTPKMVNDIQEFELIQALAYEVKWKIWEYNQLIPVQTKKLFYIYRAQQNLMLGVIGILLLALFQFLSQYIYYKSNIFIQIIFGIVGIRLAFFSDAMIEKTSFWNKK